MRPDSLSYDYKPLSVSFSSGAGFSLFYDVLGFVMIILKIYGEPDVPVLVIYLELLMIYSPVYP